jgi:hypothetical protein
VERGYASRNVTMRLGFELRMAETTFSTEHCRVPSECVRALRGARGRACARTRVGERRLACCRRAERARVRHVPPLTRLSALPVNALLTLRPVVAAHPMLRVLRGSAVRRALGPRASG